MRPNLVEHPSYTVGSSLGHTRFCWVEASISGGMKLSISSHLCCALLPPIAERGIRGKKSISCWQASLSPLFLHPLPTAHVSSPPPPTRRYLLVQHTPTRRQTTMGKGGRVLEPLLLASTHIGKETRVWTKREAGGGGGGEGFRPKNSLLWKIAFLLPCLLASSFIRVDMLHFATSKRLSWQLTEQKQLPYSKIKLLNLG